MVNDSDPDVWKMYTFTFQDEEIDPRDVDIGFHDESTPKPTPKSTTSTTTLPPTVATQGRDPHKHHNQETNFFAQPGILAGNWELVIGPVSKQTSYRRLFFSCGFSNLISKSYFLFQP